MRKGHFDSLAKKYGYKFIEEAKEARQTSIRPMDFRIKRLKKVN